MQMWMSIKDPAHFSTLSLDELTNLSNMGQAKAYELGVNIPKLITSLTYA